MFKCNRCGKKSVYRSAMSCSRCDSSSSADPDSSPLIVTIPDTDHWNAPRASDDFVGGGGSSGGGGAGGSWDSGSSSGSDSSSSSSDSGSSSGGSD